MRKKNELSVPTYCLSQFVFSKQTGSLVAELSDLDVRPGQQIFGRLWNDACDEGIAICNYKTNKVVRFYLSSRDEREGEVFGWRFKPVADSDCKAKEVLLIND